MGVAVVHLHRAGTRVACGRMAAQCRAVGPSAWLTAENPCRACVRVEAAWLATVTRRVLTTGAR
jgi:hypothetical protein